MTVNDHVVRYQEHVSTKSYEELVAAFEETVPDAGSGEPTRTLERVRDSENSRAAWEAAVAPLFGPSGFTRVFSLDTGQIISWYGKPAKGPQIGRSADSTSADGSSGTLLFHRHTEPPPSSAVRCCGRSSVHVVHRSQKSVLSPFLNVPLSIEAVTEWETPWVLDARNQRILGSAWS